MDAKILGQNKKILVVKVGEKIKDNQTPARNLTAVDMSSQGKSHVLKSRTLGWWCISKKRAEKVDYVVAIEKGSNKIVSAYDVKDKSNKAWLIPQHNRNANPNNKRPRYGFDVTKSKIVTNINGHNLFPNVVLKNYKFVDASGNTRKASNPVTYID